MRAAHWSGPSFPLASSRDREATRFGSVRPDSHHRYREASMSRTKHGRSIFGGQLFEVMPNGEL